MKRTTIAMATAAVFASAAYAAPAFEAGTYQAKAPGMHGDVVVETMFAKDRIEAVKVVKQAETQGIGTKAVEVLPGRIVEAQSPNVDGVSGATLTSNAIRTAVADCVKQAGVDPASLVPLAVK